MALETVREHNMRSMLTILGLRSAFVTGFRWFSIIQGLDRSFAQQLESLGSNTIFISKFNPSFGRPPKAEELHRKELDSRRCRRDTERVAPRSFGVFNRSKESSPNRYGTKINKRIRRSNWRNSLL
jgi:hypothetical protein